MSGAIHCQVTNYPQTQQLKTRCSYMAIGQGSGWGIKRMPLAPVTISLLTGLQPHLKAHLGRIHFQLAHMIARGIQFLVSCGTEGYSSSPAVGWRLPSEPLHGFWLSSGQASALGRATGGERDEVTTFVHPNL